MVKSVLSMGVIGKSALEIGHFLRRNFWMISGGPFLSRAPLICCWVSPCIGGEDSETPCFIVFFEGRPLDLGGESSAECPKPLVLLCFLEGRPLHLGGESSPPKFRGYGLTGLQTGNDFPDCLRFSPKLPRDRPKRPQKQPPWVGVPQMGV